MGFRHSRSNSLRQAEPGFQPREAEGESQVVGRQAQGGRGGEEEECQNRHPKRCGESGGDAALSTGAWGAEPLVAKPEDFVPLNLEIQRKQNADSSYCTTEAPSLQGATISWEVMPGITSNGKETRDLTGMKGVRPDSNSSRLQAGLPGTPRDTFSSLTRLLENEGFP